jgi:hypothetical protein
MDAGKSSIEDDDVVAVDRGLIEGIGAIEADVDGHSLLAEAPRHEFSQLNFVFDHEYSHQKTSGTELTFRLITGR